MEGRGVSLSFVGNKLGRKSEGSVLAARSGDSVNSQKRVESLLDICAKYVAEHIPFQRIEEKYARIPEPVQRRIIFWSFPRKESEIRMYSTFSAFCSSDHQSLPFYKGLRLTQSGNVENVLQVGFHLSGTVICCRSTPTPPAATVPPPPTAVTTVDSATPTNNTSTIANITPAPQSTVPQKYRVSISFDRCKITSVTCTCNTRDIFWCPHVVALSLYRIRYADSVQLRIPISETLLQMDRQQLQKLVQYLITEHHTEVLPTAQHLSDQILQQAHPINSIQGAPDPTAGGSAEEEHCWHLDADQVKQQVGQYLNQAGYYNANKQLYFMFSKVREMEKARDTNGAKMLTMITEQFLNDPRLLLWKNQGNPMSDKCRQHWDQIAALWVCVVLAPHHTKREKNSWKKMLEKWADTDVCPLEDADFYQYEHSYSPPPYPSSGDDSSEDEEVRRRHVEFIRHQNRQVIRERRSQNNRRWKRRRYDTPPRTIFHRAIDACSLSWEDDHLQAILTGKAMSRAKLRKSDSQFNELNQPLWHEKLVVACSRVDALRWHGYTNEALRLAVAIVRTLKQAQRSAYLWWEAKKESNAFRTSSGQTRYRPDKAFGSTSGWIGHQLDPITCLFDTLAEASLVPEDMARFQYHTDWLGVSSEETASLTPLRYRHIAVPDSCESESYLTLALEAAMIGLGQQRTMARGGPYAVEKTSKHEDKMILRLQELTWDGPLLAVLRKQTRLLIDGGPFAGIGEGVRLDSAPLYTFAKFLFTALLPHDEQLAYDLGLRSLRLTLVGENENIDDGPPNVYSLVMARYPRWFTLGHIESHQCALACTMINAAKNDVVRLRSVLDASLRNIHNSAHLFKLAQDAFRLGLPPDGQRNSLVLNASLELGLQVMRCTLTALNWRRREMVRWLVTCATEVGVSALISIMQNWYNLFTATEATGAVASAIMSHSTLMRLQLDRSKQDELAACARSLALQCAAKDPPSCALSALTLCESDPVSFEAAYQVVVDAAAHGMSATQLFTIAHYMEHRGYPHRAYTLTTLALQSVRIAYNQDTHPAINDIHWGVALGHTLGRTELSQMLPILVKNIHCATVLSDILRRVSITSPGMPCADTKRRIKPLPFDKPPLRQLLDATILAYINTTNSRLTHISPRHYQDFIDFLTKAHETFMLAHDGHLQFAQLIENMKVAYKGKKKLMCLVRDRFG